MSTTLSRDAKTTAVRNSRNKKYQLVRTSFCTSQGPAERTVWTDVTNKKLECLEVEMVCPVNAKHKRGLVTFTGGRSEYLDSFLQRVAWGDYVLIGVYPDNVSRVEIG